MTNAYADLTTLKSAGVLNISGAAYDSRLLDLLEAVSRLIDHYCNRRFHVVEESRFFDGDGGKELGVPDLISVTSLKTDDNRDRTFETSWAATDYLLYPPNARPDKPWGRPYTRALVDLDAGSKTFFPAGLRTVEVNGKWGYREVTEDTGADVNQGAELSAEATAITVTDAANLSAGQTLLIDSEQLYVTAVSATELTVVRGVNGTAGAAHFDVSPIARLVYPNGVAEACLIQASRLWKRRDRGFPGAEQRRTGLAGVSKALDPDVALLLAAYRKNAVGGQTW